MDNTESITPREKEVLQMVAQGLINREVAERLGISVRTVEAHRARLREKLGLRTVSDLVRYAIRLGLIDT